MTAQLPALLVSTENTLTIVNVELARKQISALKSRALHSLIEHKVHTKHYHVFPSAGTHGREHPVYIIPSQCFTMYTDAVKDK
jgi:hypothetical protein